MSNTATTLSTATDAATSTAEATAGAAETAGHAAESAGMPQLDFATFPNQIFWLLVALVIIYFVLSKIALPRIGGSLPTVRAVSRATSKRRKS